MVKRAATALLLLTALVLTGCGSSASQAEPQTSRTDVEAFVQSAADYARANGQDAALAAFTTPDGQFHQGELYIYAYDTEGNVLAHGGNPELVGQNLATMQDPNGLMVVEALQKAAQSGGGWVEYLWPNPEAGNEVQTKWGYAIDIDGTWWIGSGTYEKAS